MPAKPAGLIYTLDTKKCCGISNVATSRLSKCTLPEESHSGGGKIVIVTETQLRWAGVGGNHKPKERRACVGVELCD